MSWILHLSDPHLGDVSPGQELGDNKVHLDRQRDLETTQRVFRHTLESLKSFVEQNGRPTAAVVSGDLSYQARQGGFDAFVSLMSESADVLPRSRDRIVVVPGNHDVDWGASPGTEARYARFLKATRDEGCVTPLLDGIDFADAEPVTLKRGALETPHVIIDDEFLIVPLNSSNYCGAIVDLPDAWSESDWNAALEGVSHLDEVKLQLKKLRQHDIARVSSFQIHALRALLAASEIPVPRGDDDRVRIAVLHHQLLPVSTREELKTFESISNLGLVREALREFGFDVVLHGHKHESSLYWDFVRGRDATVSDSPRRILVVASPGHFRVGTPVMRSLRLTGEQRARNLRVTPFHGVEAFEVESPVGDEQTLPLWLTQMEGEPQDRVIIRGKTAHVVYSRLRALFEIRNGKELENLVCEVDGPENAMTLPDDYGPTTMDDRQSWFEELVAWWQRPRSRLVAEGVRPFNHGSRIYGRWGDQVERAAAALNADSHTSRALVLLVAPRETGRYPDDRRSPDEGSYPAFTLVEFALTNRRGRNQLDCFAYYRKQEMQFWWPVNLGELSLLQEAMLAKVDGKYKAQPGRLVTFSALAVFLDELPRVGAEPELDRAVDYEERFWEMGAAITFPTNEGADEAAIEWRRVLTELSGKGRRLPPLVKLGHRLLLEQVERFVLLAPPELRGKPEAVATALRELAGLYDGFTESGINDGNRALVTAAVEKLRAAVDTAFEEHAG
jgi:3',5'-cyclic AMP phosphodiesterase CpdA